jgi:hypothetical protein
MAIHCASCGVAAVVGDAQRLGVVAQDLEDPEDGALAADAVADIPVGAHDKIKAALPVLAHVRLAEGFGIDVAHDHHAIAGEDQFRRQARFEGGAVGVGLAGAGNLVEIVVGPDTGNEAPEASSTTKAALLTPPFSGVMARMPCQRGRLRTAPSTSAMSREGNSDMQGNQGHRRCQHGRKLPPCLQVDAFGRWPGRHRWISPATSTIQPGACSDV